MAKFNAAKDPRHSIEETAQWARDLGYTVRESDTRHIDGEISLDIEGFGQLTEFHYAEHPDTGFFRFKYALLTKGRKQVNIHTSGSVVVTNYDTGGRLQDIAEEKTDG